MRFSPIFLLPRQLAAQLALLHPRRLLAVPIGNRLLHRRPAGVVFLEHRALPRQLFQRFRLGANGVLALDVLRLLRARRLARERLHLLLARLVGELGGEVLVGQGPCLVFAAGLVRVAVRAAEVLLALLLRLELLVQRVLLLLRQRLGGRREERRAAEHAGGGDAELLERELARHQRCAGRRERAS